MLASTPSMNNTIPIFSSNRNIDNTTLPGQTIAPCGIASSEESIHVILSPGIGVSTFTATKPVEIGFSHRPHVDNSTLSQLDAETLDHLLIDHQTNRGEKGLPGVIAVPVCYYPRLWNSTTIFLCVSSFRSQFDMA